MQDEVKLLTIILNIAKFESLKCKVKDIFKEISLKEKQ